MLLRLLVTYVEKTKNVSLPYTIYKIISTWIKNLHVKGKTLKHLEESVEHLFDFGIRTKLMFMYIKIKNCQYNKKCKD